MCLSLLLVVLLVLLAALVAMAARISVAAPGGMLGRIGGGAACTTTSLCDAPPAAASSPPRARNTPREGNERLDAFQVLGAWDRSADAEAKKQASRVYQLVESFLSKKLGPPHKQASEIVTSVRKMARDGKNAREIIPQFREMVEASRAASAAAAASPMRASKKKGKARKGGGIASRADSRAKDIREPVSDWLSARGAPVGKYLDVGCAEGGLTVAIGGLLGLTDPKRIIGCDILDAPPGGGFTYVKASSEDLPFMAGEFDVVSCVMSLHHMPDREKSLAEIRRVLAPGGLLIIREHDVEDEGFGQFLALVHYIYASVLGDEVPVDEFDPNATAIAAYYSDSETWTKQITAAGFIHLQNVLPLVAVPKRGRGVPAFERKHDRFRSYYGFFEKTAK